MELLQSADSPPALRGAHDRHPVYGVRAGQAPHAAPAAAQDAHCAGQERPGQVRPAQIEKKTFCQVNRYTMLFLHRG